MERILVTGAAGQIGTELVPALRQRYGAENVVAAGHISPLHDDVTSSGPCTTVDVTDYRQVDSAVQRYKIDTIYHLGSILSAHAETRRNVAHQVNINGVYNVFEAGVNHNLERIFVPSSIGAFGPETPRQQTPNDTIQKPNALYGIGKVYSELLGNYYYTKLGLDVRGVRLPGIISWKTPPTGGTTDYSVAIFYGAIREQHYTCYLSPHTYLPMMYMPDCIKSIIDLAHADLTKLQHHADFNVNSLSFTPAQLAEAIKKRIPGFTIDYEIDPLRQVIADSWPDSLDDSIAREEWGWEPEYDLDATVDEVLRNLSEALAQKGGE